MVVILGEDEEDTEVGAWGQVGIFLNIAFLPRYQYPSLDQLADMIPCILQYLK